MKPAEYTAARHELGLNRVEMAQQLRTPYRTCVDWERGTRRIPGVAEVAIEGLLEKDRRFMASIGTP